MKYIRSIYHLRNLPSILWEDLSTNLVFSKVVPIFLSTIKLSEVFSSLPLPLSLSTSLSNIWNVFEFHFSIWNVFGSLKRNLLVYILKRCNPLFYNEGQREDTRIGCHIFLLFEREHKWLRTYLLPYLSTTY